MRRQRMIAAGVCLAAALLLAGCESRPDAQESTPAGSAPSAEAGAQEELASAQPGTQRESGGSQTPGGEEKDNAGRQAGLSDGVYTADFDTDSSMFHVSEADEGKGILTVDGGEMTIHISLSSKKIVNLYPGLAEDAKKEGAELLNPTVDTVTYSDGMTEEVYGFDVPVPGLDEEFDLALIGTKGKWYDHRVSVSNPEAIEEKEAAGTLLQLEDGTYRAEVILGGGSGKANVLSPAEIRVSGGKATAQIQWSSPNYDYMVVGGKTYYPVNTEGNSVFEILVEAFDVPLEAIGDTVAMSAPHEIEYTLTFLSNTIETEE